jgi:SAM-dependent methyltransferase
MHPAIRRVRRTLRDPYLLFSNFFFDPIALARSLAAKAISLPVYVGNGMRYSRGNARKSLRIRPRYAWYRSFDRYSDAGALTFHYFHQDLWAARKLFDRGVKQHVDVGSRVDGFIAHVLPFCEVTYVDIRPFALEWPGFRFRAGSITELPFADDSVASLSSLHVIEHIGLGRYGDPVDAEGSWKAAAELTRVLAPGGTLLIGVPTGHEHLCFDAHRVFAPETIRAMFASLELVEFSFIDDRNNFIRNASFEDAARAEYGCGLFELRKS